MMEDCCNNLLCPERFDDRVREFLQRKLLAASENPGLKLSFPRLILKFPFLAKTVEQLHKVFDEYCEARRLNLNQFSALMRHLIPTLPQAEINVIFQVADVNPDSVLDFKEFIVSIVLAHIIQADLSISEKVSRFVDVCAYGYLLFDPHANGFIVKADLDEMLRSEGDHSNRSMLLSADRWNELDWDKNGTISFYEFVFALNKWVQDAECTEDDDA